MLQTRFCSVLYTIIFVLCLASIVISEAFADARDVLRKADAAFNASKIGRAEELYYHIIRHVGVEPNALVRTEALNGLAAVNLLKGKYNRFDQFRRLANQEKLKLLGSSRQPSSTALIGNGDFEDGFVMPWGSGHYERRDGIGKFGTWWNSWGPDAIARKLVPTLGFFKLDADIRRSGNYSLRVTNLTPPGHNKFVTTAQRIENLRPNTLFRLTLYARSLDVKRRGLGFVVDPGWRNSPLSLPGGTYDWQHFSAFFTNGFHSSMELRLIMGDEGTQWVDDLAVEEIRLDELPNNIIGSRLKVRILFERGDYSAARKLANRLNQEGLDDQSINLLLGRALLAEGRFQQAAPIFEKLSRGSFLYSSYYLGEAYEALDRHEEAITAYKKFAKNKKNDQLAVALAEAGQARSYLRVAGDKRNRPERIRLIRLSDQLLNSSKRVIKHIGEGEFLIDIAHARALQAMENGNQAKALQEFQQGYEALEARVGEISALPAKQRVLLLRRKSKFLKDYILLLDDLAALAAEGKEKQGYEEQAFTIFQRLQDSSTGIAIAEMAARSAVRNRELASLLRRQQDLTGHRRSLIVQLEQAVIRNDQREVSYRQKMSTQLDRVENDLRQTSHQFHSQFGRFQNFSTPAVLTLREAQRLLKDREALIVMQQLSRHVGFERSLWVQVVTKTATRWIRTSLTHKALRTHVDALRCGLDRSSWEARAEICARHLGIDMADAPLEGDPLPFSLSRAYKLYEQIFGRMRDLIHGKDLILVPTGPMTQLPFQVLITQEPAEFVDGAPAYKTASWLMRQHGLTVLPSVSSFKALRANAKTSKAIRPFIGFGNPLLDGSKNEVDAAKSARAIEGCATAKSFKTADFRRARRGIRPLGFGGELTDLSALMEQSPLPETADELCSVARSSNADLLRDVVLGVRATETIVKRLNETGSLGQYKVLHFATHGTLVGELRGSTEPGLILSPPATATRIDDGLLTASEIAALNLDADWVILSACNTAGAGAENAEALSGLARSFFYAGARAVLVSHWYVQSASAVALISQTFEELRTSAGIGRADALRSAMSKLISSDTYMKHPEYWAPFIIVGEAI